MSNHEKERVAPQPETLFEPTGEFFLVQQNSGVEVITVQRQTTPSSCGDASLTMLRQPVTGEGPEDGGTSPMGVMMVVDHSEDVTDKIIKDGYPKHGSGTYLEWGRKSNTGETHVSVVIAKPGKVTVINPETAIGATGIMPLEDYRRNVAEVQAVVKVPLGPKPPSKTLRA